MNFYIINATLALDENIVLHEKQARAEKQPKKKFELAGKVKSLKRELDMLSSNSKAMAESRHRI